MAQEDLAAQKSKTAIKREFKAVQEFVKKLVNAPDSYLAKLPLSESIRGEIELARGMSKSALKRQIGYISKRMHEEPVEEAQKLLAEFQQPAAKANAYFHQIETWRDQLIDGDDELLQSLVEQYGADRQLIRRLIRNARAEEEKELPAKSARALFQHLRTISEL